jgi:hypothetical protein
MVTDPAHASGTASAVPIESDGTFVTQPLLAGTYVLEATAASFGPARAASEGAVAKVTVGTADVRDLTVKTSPNVAVTGRFRMESGNARAPWPSQIHVGAYLAFDGMPLLRAF